MFCSIYDIYSGVKFLYNYTKIEQENFNERIPKIFFGICLERKEKYEC